MERAEKAPATHKAGKADASAGSRKDGVMRVYIAITLLLLFIDRFTSLRTMRNFMVVKEPTYKI